VDKLEKKSPFSLPYNERKRDEDVVPISSSSSPSSFFDLGRRRKSLPPRRESFPLGLARRSGRHFAIVFFVCFFVDFEEFKNVIAVAL